jgi:hypothetical protein
MVEDRWSVIPRDSYEVEVIGYDLKSSIRSGKTYAQVRLRILNHGEFEGRLLFLNIFSYASAYRMLKACGIPKASPDDLTEDLIKKCLNLRMEVSVDHRRWEERIYLDIRVPQQADEPDNDGRLGPAGVGFV